MKVKIVTTVFALMIRSTKVYILVVPYCPAITPPPFCDLLSEKEGGHENSFDQHAVAMLKDGRVVGHVRVGIFFYKT